MEIDRQFGSGRVAAQGIRQALSAMGIAAFGILGCAGSAAATTYQFDLEGHSVAPLTHALVGAPVPGKPWTYLYTITDFKKGDVKLSYDDLGTSAIADDIVKIAGTVRTCTSNGESPNTCIPVRPRPPGPLHAGGDGEFDFFWDITLTSPIVDPTLDFTTTGYNNFAFEGQHAGTATAVDPNVVRGGSGTLSIMTGTPGWAFRLYDDGLGEGKYRVGLWLISEMGERVAPSVARMESYPFDRLFNGDIFAYIHGAPPPTEVPEPSTLLLLGAAGLVGASARSRRSRGEIGQKQLAFILNPK